jgi:hypothetical protein
LPREERGRRLVQGCACRILRDNGQSAKAGNLSKLVLPVSHWYMQLLRHAMQELLQIELQVFRR